MGNRLCKEAALNETDLKLMHGVPRPLSGRAVSAIRVRIAAVALPTLAAMVLFATSPAFAAVGIDIRIAPPPPRVIVAPPPRPGFVWAPGYWRWDGRRHIWVDGRWLRARPGRHWVPEHWVARPGHYRFVPGHWARG